MLGVQPTRLPFLLVRVQPRRLASRPGSIFDCRGGNESVRKLEWKSPRVPRAWCRTAGRASELEGRNVRNAKGLEMETPVRVQWELARAVWGLTAEEMGLREVLRKSLGAASGRGRWIWTHDDRRIRTEIERRS